MTMIEKVARALDPSIWQAHDSGANPVARQMSLDAARRAIEAMRDLTPAMDKALDQYDYDARWLWDEAIDAALNEEAE